MVNQTVKDVRPPFGCEEDASKCVGVGTGSSDVAGPARGVLTLRDRPELTLCTGAPSNAGAPSRRLTPAVQVRTLLEF
jgi:hypothetical protein